MANPVEAAAHCLLKSGEQFDTIVLAHEKEVLCRPSEVRLSSTRYKRLIILRYLENHVLLGTILVHRKDYQCVGYCFRLSSSSRCCL
jgi:hypothetical protein